ncbi:hypothetical protein K458DRAFT_416179 [Lentithecium fluviatile CBS 122367]|uniref:C2H2-type domain-containing protein n=1 Tax=Lentithecium fluviatile CBS 122367 TaxID=1168545 RepID=A0A6G1J9K8_9PLEO|nr:hypothetical protein K458DRAFT_416179 [Lentithecium fluviatile CBS 122367]
MVETNIPLPTRQRLGSWNNCVYGSTSVNHLTPYQPYVPACYEHQLMTCSPQRVFEFDGRRDPTSPYSYMAEWALENSRRWSQRGHLGSRYPICEGDEPGKPFYRAALFYADSSPPQYAPRNNGYNVVGWACLFPGCEAICPRFLQLRGHHYGQHPAQPRSNRPFYGNYACPSAGCDRLGTRGFNSKGALETHLLGHHLRACTALV